MRGVQGVTEGSNGGYQKRKTVLQRCVRLCSKGGGGRGGVSHYLNLTQVVLWLTPIHNFSSLPQIPRVYHSTKEFSRS